MSAAVAALAGYGVFLVFTGAVLRWPGLVRPAPSMPSLAATRQLDRAALVLVLAGAFGGALVAAMVFGAALPAAAGAALGALLPRQVASARRRRRRDAARESWPRLIEDIRLHAGALGQSVPQALFAAGRGAPPELIAAFTAAEREWVLSTDFERSLATLKERLDDPAADTVSETLLVAHEIGGNDLDGRLADLAADRILDLQSRRDAEAKQAGVRFARRFVLFVPIGMALAGLGIGEGRAAYATTAGQLGVVFGFAVVGACWWWSGVLMRLPEPDRIFR